jgi:hypothetical protein
MTACSYGGSSVSLLPRGVRRLPDDRGFLVETVVIAEGREEKFKRLRRRLLVSRPSRQA